MTMRNWLPALCAAVLTLGTGCGKECVDTFDCVNDKGPAPEGQFYVCAENTCELRDIPEPAPTDGGEETDGGDNTPTDGGTDGGDNTPTDGGTDGGDNTPTDGGTDGGALTCTPACASPQECDTTTGACVACATDAHCAGLDATKPYCLADKSGCVQCRDNSGCGLGQVCNASNTCEAQPGPAATDTSAQIAAFLAATDAAVTEGSPLAIEGAYVTYTKPTVGNDVAGFFLQAEPNGPAMFVSDAAALAQVKVGDRISLSVTARETISALARAKTVTGLTKLSEGHAVKNLSTGTPAGLAVDHSKTTDLQSNVATYESELAFMAGNLADVFDSGPGFVAFNINNADITGTSVPRLRVPATLSQQLDMAKGCSFTLKAGPVWRFNNNAQLSAFEAADLTLSGCPAPKLLMARALSATEVRLTFDRKLAADSVQAEDFTIDPLAVTNPVVSDNVVTLTTTAQTASQAYTVSVSGEVKDLSGSAVAAPATAQFTGFVPPPSGPSLVINEVDYDTVGNDNAEFVEIFNRGDQPAELADIVILVVNGGMAADSPTAQRKEYNRFSLAQVKNAAGETVPSLPAGGYIIAAPQPFFNSNPNLPEGTLRLVITSTSASTPDTDIIQNGNGDGVGLLQNATGVLLDSVFYESGSQDSVFRITTGAGDKTLDFAEGTRTSAADSNGVPGSLQRVPNGADTNNNNYDFMFLAPTPGAATP